MARVLKFPLARARAARSRKTAAGEVIIFPGVRIERREFNLTDRLASSASHVRTLLTRRGRLDDRLG